MDRRYRNLLRAASGIEAKRSRHLEAEPLSAPGSPMLRWNGGKWLWPGACHSDRLHPMAKFEHSNVSMSGCRP